MCGAGQWVAVVLILSLNVAAMASRKYKDFKRYHLVLNGDYGNCEMILVWSESGEI